ncbi:MAG: RDD family protein [bacterium]|nr:RDD family protein [bacterium]
MDRASFTTRLLATLIDGVIIIVLMVLSVVALTIFAKYGLEITDTNTIKGFVKTTWVTYIVTIPYYATEIFFSGSPGKRIFGIYIGDAEGNRPGNKLKIWRMICKMPGLLALPILVFGLLYILIFKNMSKSVFAFGMDLIWLANVANFIVMLGSLMALSYSREALHDRLSGTGIFHGPMPQDAGPTIRSGRINESPLLRPPPRNNNAVDKLLFK